MLKIIREMRRRNMFRAAGLYIGMSWIIIEAAATVLPAFNVPEWIFRGLIILAFIGFPVAMVLAWVYQLTESGLQRDTVVRESEAAPLVSGRVVDFAVIGVLLVALSFSVYLNLRSPPVAPEDIPPISLLIADIDDLSNDPLFQNTLEHALAIGLEESSFITSYSRESALKISKEIRAGDTLTEAIARLVAVREGIDFVVAGSIEPNKDKFEIEIRILDPQSGESQESENETASSKTDVLAALGTITTELRVTLGDQTAQESDNPEETFTTASLEAMREYVVAQELARSGRDEEALIHYRNAVDEDPDFGRAYSGWALSAFKLGQTEESERLWKKTLTLLEGMTEREKYRTLGVYYSIVSKNLGKATETYEELVSKYPADGAGHNNLAVAYFMQRDFDGAMTAGKKVQEIYPKKLLYGANLALFAMYAGQYETAVTEAEKVLAVDPAYYKAYLPAALAAINDRNFTDAAVAYTKMQQAGPRGASLALMGKADLAIYQGNFSEARSLLQTGITEDQESGNQRALAGKQMALAEIEIIEDHEEQALASVSKSLNNHRSTSQLVSAALLYLKLDRTEEAQSLAEELEQKLQPISRAYAKMINGMILLQENDHVAAIDALNEALEFSDAWLVRLNLGIAYFQAGHHAEALSEFEMCKNRQAEASAVFLDDVPSARVHVSLPYWLGSAKDALGMTSEAQRLYQQYLKLRPVSSNDPLSIQADSRLGSADDQN